MADVPDSKKVQTLINHLANAVIKARDARDAMIAVRDKFIQADPDVTGTPLEGAALSAVDAAITAFNNEMSKTIWTSIINAKVPTHEGKALD